MAAPEAAPDEDIDRVADSHGRLLVLVDGLSDEIIRRPSLLPDWTVGHVLTHLARNADSHARRTAAAIEGVVVDQYPGGPSGRAAEIEDGARRPAAEILDDVRMSANELDRAWAAVPEGAWSGISRDVSGRERQLRDLPARRWREVEVHIVDLGIGVSHRDWSQDFVERWLQPTRASAFDDPRDELAWLYGRLKRGDLPEPPPWG